jgi:hypothetical protein
MDIATAMAIRALLFTDTKEYTYDPKCCPVRVANIREVIVSLDSKIEKKLEEMSTND